MNIVPYGSTLSISPAQRLLTDQILSRRALLFDLLLADVAERVPVLLVDHASMEQYQPGYLGDYHKGWHRAPVEWLATLVPASFGLFHDKPAILLCPERIAATADGENAFRLLLAFVIAYNLTRALMVDELSGNPQAAADRDGPNEFLLTTERALVTHATLNLLLFDATPGRPDSFHLRWPEAREKLPRAGAHIDLSETSLNTGPHGACTTPDAGTSLDKLFSRSLKLSFIWRYLNDIAPEYTGFTRHLPVTPPPGHIGPANTWRWAPIQCWGTIQRRNQGQDNLDQSLREAWVETLKNPYMMLDEAMVNSMLEFDRLPWRYTDPLWFEPVDSKRNAGNPSQGRR